MDLRELPQQFQDAFEAAKARAESDDVANLKAMLPAGLRIPALIQNVAFAYCAQARNACRRGNWTAHRVRQAVECALPGICDWYYLREVGACSEAKKLEARQIYAEGIVLDERWNQHLSELEALAARPEAAGDTFPTVETAAGAQMGRPESAAPIIGGAASVQPVTVNGGKRKNPEPQFPNRASWLKLRLQERSWNKHDLSRHGGPDCKTVQKILDGQRIREEGLEKVATALSKAPTSKKLPTVTLLDIPQD